MCLGRPPPSLRLLSPHPSPFPPPRIGNKVSASSGWVDIWACLELRGRDYSGIIRHGSLAVRDRKRCQTKKKERLAVSAHPPLLLYVHHSIIIPVHCNVIRHTPAFLLLSPVAGCTSRAQQVCLPDVAPSLSSVIRKSPCLPPWEVEAPKLRGGNAPWKVVQRSPPLLKSPSAAAPSSPSSDFCDSTGNQLPVLFPSVDLYLT